MNPFAVDSHFLISPDVAPFALFLQIMGVTRVIPGYCGGTDSSTGLDGKVSTSTTSTPNFNNMRDHFQAMFVEYHPKTVSYTEILATACMYNTKVNFQQTVIFPSTEQQVKEGYAFLSKVHEKISDMSERSNKNDTDFDFHDDDEEDDEEEDVTESMDGSHSWNNNNAYIKKSIAALGSLSRPLSIDVREPVTIFYQAEEQFCGPNNNKQDSSRHSANF